MSRYIFKNFICYYFLMGAILLYGCVLPGAQSGGNESAEKNTLDQNKVIASLDKSSAVQDQGKGLSLTPTILINFSKDIVTSTVNSQSVKLQDSRNQNQADYSLAVSNNKVSVDINTPLSPDTEYKIILNDLISDSAGNKLQEVTFTTGQSIFPTASIIYPTDYSSNIVKHPLIQLHFSSQVNHLEKDKTVGIFDEANNLVGISDITISFIFTA